MHNTIESAELAHFEHVADAITIIVAKSLPYRLLGASPCVGWTRRDVLNHMVGGADLFAACARGQVSPLPDWSDMPDWLGSDPAGAYRQAADRALVAYSSPGVLAGTVTMPWGETPAPFALAMLTSDHVAHSWDLTRGCGVAVCIDDAVIANALATACASISPDFRQAGFYHLEQTVFDGASPLERLAAFTGRTVDPIGGTTRTAAMA
jgi:uncharacterized protein (TIGR03086 family)